MTKISIALSDGSEQSFDARYEIYESGLLVVIPSDASPFALAPTAWLRISVLHTPLKDVLGSNEIMRGDVEKWIGPPE